MLLQITYETGCVLSEGKFLSISYCLCRLHYSRVHSWICYDFEYID